MMTFATKLKKAMAERGMSFEMLSTVSGIEKETILQYISGEREPNKECRDIIAQVISFPERYFDDDFDIGTTKMTYAAKLRRALDEKGLNLSEFSAISGINKSSVSNYLSGKNEPSRERKAAIAAVLCLPEQYFDDDFEVVQRISGEIKSKLSVTVAARLMGISPQALRVGIRLGKFPFGVCFERASGDNYYYISPRKFTEWTGIEIPRKKVELDG